MKRFLTIFCAIAFSGAALSAQNKADDSAYMINVGYSRGYRADIELSWVNKSIWGISSSHGFSFGNGLYVGGGAGFGAELTKDTAARTAVNLIDPEYSYTPESNWNASYFVPVFADIKYSFTKTLVTPFVSMKGGMIADITNKGARTFANPAVGLDIAILIEGGIRISASILGIS